jgi:phosphatidate cytidylyltransferase
MLGQRLLSAAFFVPLLLVGVFLGDPWYSLVIGLIAALASLEFYRMMREGGHAPLRYLGSFFALLFVGLAYLAAHSLAIAGQEHLTTAAVAVALLVPLVGLLARPSPQRAASDWALTVAGSLYVGWLLGYFILLRNLPHGLFWVLLAILATFACDSAAYLGGQAWGRHPLIPHLSPGKTWEGAMAGLAAALGAVLILTLLFQYLIPPLWAALSPLQATALGVLVGVTAQVGDLAESLLKRSAQVKDAGGLIPGHGGILDRLDSLLFAVPAVYFYALWLVS